MNGPACAYWPELGRTAQPGADPRLRAHLDGCGACRGELDQIAVAVRALKAVPYEPPDDDAREQARTRLVAAIGHALAARPAPRRLWAKGAAVVAASLCGATVLAAVGTRVLESRREAALVQQDPRTHEPGKQRRRAARQTASPVVAVAPAPPPLEPVPAPVSEPPAPEVDAPAPVMDAPVEAPARPATMPVLLLKPARAPTRTMRAVVESAGASRRQGAAGPAELAFDQGWEALRAGDHLGAAAQMERALVLGAGGHLDEDARYWRAVALGRAGAAGQARAAMQQFLRLHPGSARAGTVAAMLGWLLYDAGELALARQAFGSAAEDPSPAVRRSAAAGLELLGAR